MTPKSINIHCNWVFLTSQISHSSKKCEIKCPAQKLTTQYKFCLMDAVTKRTGGEGRLNADNCGQWREGCQKLAKSCGFFYGWPLINFCRFIKLQISFTICMFLPFKGMFLNYQFRLFIYFKFSSTFQRACLWIVFTKIHLLFFMVMFFTKFLKTCIINAYFRLWIFDTQNF